MGLSCLVFGQKNDGYPSIEGRILDAATREPILYANIFNKTLQKGTISNSDGYFRVEAKSLQDSIFVTFIGYTEHKIKLQANAKFYTVMLEESAQLLGEVVVTPRLNSYLFELLANAKRRPPKASKMAKAYYELKSFRDSQQVELVEGFYNVGVQGYELTDLQLKAGRLAMQPQGDRFFASMESSMAITMSKLMARNTSYPSNPLDLTKRAMMKNYSLHLSKKYLENGSDSIYVVDFEPVAKPGLLYKGTIWINKTKNYILKINLSCEDCQLHPFLPIFSTDSIANVSLNITKTFVPVDGDIVFNHVDFTYGMDYKSRKDQAQAQVYTIATKAILYAYDFQRLFELPKIEYATSTFKGRDYRLINAMPYNDFFWKNNDEYRLNEFKNLNENYFDAAASVTNKKVFKKNDKFKGVGLFEQPFVFWSSNRVQFREVVADTTNSAAAGNFKSEQYHLAVKIFMDTNTYKDSTDILTATIFDPYESYYHLPMDNKTRCFVNLFFDFCEIERRKLEAALKAVRHDPIELNKLKSAFATDFEMKKREFIKSMERGTREAAVLKWNDYVRAHLGIDNVLIFMPFQTNEGSE